MKVVDLNGREHGWNLNGLRPKNNDIRPRSQHHLRARNLLKSLFPTDQILEEVPLPGTRLRADFYLPMRKLAIEVHGEQHYKFIQYFHGSKKGFLRAKKNDQDKILWFQNNNIQVVELPYTETDNEWRRRIQRR